jgi:trehalose 6-phosphate synthase
VNRLFARKLIELVRDDDTIWVHDYHLIPLAAELRALGCGARIGFFLHIPLPPADLLVALPEHRHLLATFSAYDLVGFHTESYRRAFEDYFRHEARASVDGDRITTSGGRRFRVGVFPIGIDTAGVAAAAANAAGSAATRELVESLQGRRLIIGVDRLDYSKGLPGRFKALGQFLAAHPDQHGQVSLLQIAPPSREEVIEYRRLRAQLERVAGAVNGRYARPDWVPIRYVNNSYDLDTLAGFYRSADVGLVTPLRDGMNLVAKEFIASQESAAPGVLILSRFAGAVHELTGALVVNPFDSEDISEAIARALAMPLPERRERWRAQMNVLERNDVNAWRSAYLGALAEGSESRQPLATAQVA